jgi:hypothetical protein
MKRNSLGSETFGTSTIRTDEYVMILKVKLQSNLTANEIRLEMELLDDLLSIQRIQSIARAKSYTPTGRQRKNASFLEMIDTRLNQHLENLKNQH